MAAHSTASEHQRLLSRDGSEDATTDDWGGAAAPEAVWSGAARAVASDSSHTASGEARSQGPASLRRRRDGEGLIWTSDIDCTLPIKMGDGGPAAKPATTILSHFSETVDRHGNSAALRHKRDGVWVTWSWQFYQALVRRFAKSCISMGLKRFDVVCVLGFNAPEWNIAAVGTIAAGCVTAGIYTTSSSEACGYIAKHSEAKVVVCEDAEQADKFLRIRDQLPHLRAIVVWKEATLHTPEDGGGSMAHLGLMTWGEFLGVGAAVEDAQLEERIAAQRPENCAALIYTSGTTGTPKAAMISHDNITWTAKSILDIFHATHAERMVSYLPCSHIAAAMLDVYGPLIVGYQVYFAEPDALRGSLVETLKEVRPTIFFGVPRVYEKIREKMLAFGRANNCLLRAIAAWAKRRGLEASRAEEAGRPKPATFCIANALVYRNVRRALGLDRCRAQFSGAAPMAPITLEYFQSLYLPVNELYGMTECTGPQSVNYPGNRRTGSSGTRVPGTEMAIHDPDVDGRGEVCFRGRNVFMGYLKDPVRTEETLDTNGFLHSGDVGCIDSTGFLHLRGRRKELIITSGGENVAPAPIEDALKAAMPFLGNAVVVGDGQRFLACLLTLQTKVDSATGAASDDLEGSAREFVKSCGVTDLRASVACRSAAVQRAVADGVEQANEASVSRAQKVRKWTILPTDFSIEGGELTSAFKLKRFVVQEKYRDVIEELYAVDRSDAV